MDKKSYTQSGLLKMGFTMSAIKELLPNPDNTSVNPKYKRAAPTKWFNGDRVHAIMNTEEFKKFKKRPRSDSSNKKAAYTKGSNLLNKVDEFPIIVYAKNNIDELIEEAIWSTWEYHQRKYGVKQWQLNKYYSPAEYIKKKYTVNYIKYNYSNYKNLLARLKGQVGQESARLLIEYKLLHEIKRVYPFLSDYIDDFLNESDEDEKYLISNCSKVENLTRIVNILDKISNLESLEEPAIIKIRQEQKLLREHLTQGKSEHTCSLCERILPVKLLSVAHIKARHACNKEEKRDVLNLMLLCPLCDKFFEEGYIGVSDGIVIQLDQPGNTKDSLELIEQLIGKRCSVYNKNNKEYFQWRLENHNSS